MILNHPSTLALAACLLSCAGQAVAGPTATMAQATHPLKEIGRVHVQTPFCKDVFDRGSLATSSALLNDAELDATAHFLDTVELDDNQLAKPTTITDLQKRYQVLMARAGAAIDETKALRQLADAAPAPDQKAALTDYANALGGALHRQMLVAEYYRRFAMYLEVHEPVSWQERDRALFYAARTPPGPMERSGDPRDRVPPTLTEVARFASSEITTRHERAVGDELHAAQTAQAAFGPCSVNGSI